MIDFKPLTNYLTNEIDAPELAELLNTFAFDYFRLILSHYEDAEEVQQYIHEDAKHFLFHLKRLIDVLIECKEQKTVYLKKFNDLSKICPN